MPGKPHQSRARVDPAQERRTATMPETGGTRIVPGIPGPPTISAGPEPVKLSVQLNMQLPLSRQLVPRTRAGASSSLASSTSFWARMEVVRAENPPTADERPVERELADSSARRRSSRQRSSPILGPFCPFADGWPSRKD